jgi:hypothetical protein
MCAFGRKIWQKGDVSKLLDRLRSTSPATVVGETRRATRPLGDSQLTGPVDCPADRVTLMHP